MIPDSSSLICEDGEFHVNLLQPGLSNEDRNNLCYLNSLFFLMHRIQIKNLMYDDHGCEDNVLGLFRLILLAMPSQGEFNVVLFLNTWNNTNRPRFKLGQQQDPGEFLDFFLGEYGSRFKKESISTFEVALLCNFCHAMQSKENFDPHYRMPTIDISDAADSAIINLSDRFDAFMNEKGITDKCKDCKKVGAAKRKEVRGKVRIIKLNRNKNVNRVPLKSHARVDLSSFNVLSCILHIGYNCISFN